MPNSPKLSVEKRNITGKKLQSSRRVGKIPGNIYGKDTESLAVFLDDKVLRELLKIVNESALLELTVDGEKKTRPVVLREVLHDPFKPLIVHVSFQQVDLKEKITVTIPIVLIGEAPAVESATGVLDQSLYELKIEALPADIPENISIDISELSQPGDKLIVSDVKTNDKIEILNEPDSVIVSVVEPQPQEEEQLQSSEKEQVEQVEATEEHPETQSE